MSSTSRTWVSSLPIVVHDLPAGGKRIVQRARGYRHTFVHGTEVARDGEDTGARPGRLLRGFQTGPTGRVLSPNRLAPDTCRCFHHQVLVR